MSRIGKAPVEIPDKVNVEIDGNVVKVTGPKGSLSVTLQPSIKIEKQDGKLVL
ncbi:MAG: 50S ribosomal protein L6, partial [Candidatus Gastranaerophilales bacterium]|nr:50S ribosomal protein L6 [Candidatus Gastranaerophilales bacterium]